VVLVISNLHFEMRIMHNGAKEVKRGDSWIESQFIGAHLAGIMMSNANECLEIVLTLEIVVLQGHATSTVEETSVEDGPTESNVERITHKGASGEVETSDVCNFVEISALFRMAFVILAWRLCDLSSGVLLIIRESKRERTYDLLGFGFLFACRTPREGMRWNEAVSITSVEALVLRIRACIKVQGTHGKDH